MNRPSCGALAAIVFTGAAAAIAGCYTAPESDPSAAFGAAGGGATANAASLAARGLPCDVQSLLAERCAGCHSASHPNTPMALGTYDDLTAPAASDPKKTVAELALARIRSDASPMPPSGPRVGDAQVAAFAAWVGRGAPRETCGSDPAASAREPTASTSPLSEPPPIGNPSTTCGSLDNAEWQNIYATYVGPGTPGHCANSGCHASTNGGWSAGPNPTASSMLSAWIQRGLVSPASPATSRITSTSSPLAWFNPSGPMPKDNRAANPQAAAAIRAWLAAAGACDAGTSATPSGPSSGSTACPTGTVSMTVSVTAADPADYVEIRPSRSTVYDGAVVTECLAPGARVELRSTGLTTWTGTSCGRSSRCSLSATTLSVAATID